MTIPTLDGITAKTITTDRITTRVLFSGPEDGTPVLFVHGNLSSATWWEDTMVKLPEGYWGIAPDLRGYGEADPNAIIDATRGMDDLADDVFALLDHLNIEQAHVVGNSLGGMVVWRMMIDAPGRLLTVTQVAPGSFYGFGGTKDISGTPCWGDFAGTGAGLVNPALVEAIQNGDDGSASPASPRNVLNTLIFNPPFRSEREDTLVAAMLSTHIGERAYPGDTVSSPNWPGFAPGIHGPNNATSPKYAPDPANLFEIEPKPPVLWVRGSADRVVSNAAAGDLGTLGAAGIIPGWPGVDVFPSQPMVSQTRAVLDEYARSGGQYDEVVIDDAGHTPFIEKPDEFNAVFHKHIGAG